jgi:hypothetical protein
MTIDLSKIDCEQFKFALNSNIEMKKISTDENITDDSNIKLDKESNGITIDIDKTKLNLNKIVLYYEIPEDIEVGTKLQLEAQVIISEDDKENIIDKNQVEITIADNENQEDNKNENNKIEGDKNFEGNVNQEQQENQSNETVSKNQNNMNDMQITNSNQAVSYTSSTQSMASSSNLKTSTAQAETATYNGSNNNYLSSLEIDGVELTSDFNKEKLTYFATVEGLETITVTANAEDSSSKVAITGTDLKSGENKVLISVTAENGDVRYYRIYVIKF